MVTQTRRVSADDWREIDVSATQPAEILGNATIYLCNAYPFIMNGVLRQTPERRAAEILCALKDVIELANWDCKWETKS